MMTKILIPGYLKFLVLKFYLLKTPCIKTTYFTSKESVFFHSCCVGIWKPSQTNKQQKKKAWSKIPLIGKKSVWNDWNIQIGKMSDQIHRQ